MTAHLEVRGLAKTFRLHMLGGRRLDTIEDVGFTVERGEFVGVVGRSGSGKSTLLRCLFRRYLPSAGRIVYASEDGPVDLAAADDRAVLRVRARELGYVGQFLQAIPRTSARDIVAGALTRAAGGDRPAAAGRADEMLETLGIAPALRDAFPATMSGGERQRVNLARALIARPRFVLLDEPTSALDPASRSLAVQAIRSANAAGTTMVGIFHDLDSLIALADRVLLLEAGRLRWQGPPGQVADVLAAA